MNTFTRLACCAIGSVAIAIASTLAIDVITNEKADVMAYRHQGTALITTD